MIASIAQINPKFGNIKVNLQKHYYYTDIAIKNRANLIVFPEMSLTGYCLRDLVPELSIGPDFSILNTLLEMSHEIGIILSFPEKTKDFHYFISSAYLHKGQIIHIHRKIYAPINGMFDDLKDFKKGQEIKTFDLQGFKAGMLICRDIWHIDTVASLALQGAKLIIVPSAVPLRSIGTTGPNIDVFMERTVRSYAEKSSLYFIFANRVGFEEGMCFYGGSKVAGPNGDLIMKMNFLDEDFSIFEISSRNIERRISILPLDLEQEDTRGKFI